jgi:hypothetical protein
MYRPKGVVVANSVYEEAFRRNGDGGGFCYVDEVKGGGKDIIVEKGFMNMAAMQEALDKHRGKEMLIHFRRASAGGVSKENCHPFDFFSESFPWYSFAIIHNGTLPFRSTNTKSDTSCFVSDILEPVLDRDPYYFDHGPSTWIMERLIGLNNKILIMRYNAKDKETKVYILNPEQGVKYRGCWMSNESFLPPPPVKTWSPPVGGYMGGDDFYPRGNTHPTTDRFSRFDLSNWWNNPATGKYERKPLMLKEAKQPEVAKTEPPATDVSLLLAVVIKHMDVLSKKLLSDEKWKKEVASLTDDEKRFENLIHHSRGKPMPYTDLGLPKGPIDASTLTESEKAKVDAIYSANKDAQSGGPDRPLAPVIPMNQPSITGIGPGDKPITVPRDADVKKAAAVKSTIRGTYFSLGKKNKRVMESIIDEYGLDLCIPEWDGMSFHQRLLWTRDDVRSSLPYLDDMTDAQLDQWIIDEVEQEEGDRYAKECLEEQQSEKRLEEEAALKVEIMQEHGMGLGHHGD